MESEENKQQEVQRSTWKRWVARFGIAGFLFFLVKGMLWLIVPGLILWLGINQ